RVLVTVRAPFKTDFRQDLEFQWHEKSETGRAEVVSAADSYNRSAANATLFSKAGEAGAKKRYDQAISLLRQIVERDPNDFPAWQELGTTYFIQKKLDEAEKDYTVDLKRHAEYVVALVGLGRGRVG